MIDIRNNRVMLEVACNDPDNGVFAGAAEMINIGTFVEFELLGAHTPTFRELGDRIRLAGKQWPIEGSKEWIGNWCWNGYWIKIPVLVDFLVWLHSRKLYSLTCGESRIFNRWRLREPFGAKDREFLTRQLGKPSNHEGW
jgi:hypothetical protein